jgi:hypothetical protein
MQNGKRFDRILREQRCQSDQEPQHEAARHT